MSTGPDDFKNMTCQEFQELMPELIASGEDASKHPHAQNCELCSALLADLQAIAQAARDLFEVDPPDDLLGRIQSAIREEEDANSK